MDFFRAIALLKAHVAGTGNLTIGLWYQTAKVRTDAPDNWARVNLVGGGSALTLVGNDDGCSGDVDILGTVRGTYSAFFGSCGRSTANGMFA